MNGLEFGTTKRSHDTPITHSPMEISVRTVFEQHLTLQAGEDHPSINTDERVHNESKASGLDNDVECGE